MLIDCTRSDITMMIKATAGITLVISFAITFYLMPIFIRKLEENGYMAKDMYKRFKVDIPTKGGIAVLFSLYFTVVIVPVFFRILNRINSDVDVPEALSQTDQAMLLVIVMFAVYGIVDDLIDVGRPAKVFLSILFSFPLLVVVTPQTLTLPFIGTVDFQDGIYVPFFGTQTYSRITRFIIMPLYIMVVANLMNMHSGFNGMQSGLSTIILLALLVKCVIEGTSATVITLGAVAGSMGAFWYFNRYPARIFEGNIGSLAVGATIGSAIIVNGFIVAGFVMLIPHTVNFLMYVYWRIQNLRYPEDRKYRTAKFGSLLANGNIDVPNPYTLKWVLPYYYKMNEKQAAMAMYAVTIVFCIAGLFVPT